MTVFREQINVEVEAEVASILRSRAVEAHATEGEIIGRAVRAYDLRLLVASIRARSGLAEDAALALVREEPRSARVERDAVRPAVAHLGETVERVLQETGMSEDELAAPPDPRQTSPE